MDLHNDYEKVEEKEDGERQLCCRFERQQCLEFAMLMTLLIAQFAGMCVDMLPLPFLTLEGKERGLKEIQVGIIFGSYDLARGIISPFIGTLVSVQNGCLCAKSMKGAPTFVWVMHINLLIFSS